MRYRLSVTYRPAPPTATNCFFNFFVRLSPWPCLAISAGRSPGLEPNRCVQIFLSHRAVSKCFANCSGRRVNHPRKFTTHFFFWWHHVTNATATIQAAQHRNQTSVEFRRHMPPLHTPIITSHKYTSRATLPSPLPSWPILSHISVPSAPPPTLLPPHHPSCLLRHARRRRRPPPVAAWRG
jgi:hypothetical protein